MIREIHVDNFKSIAHLELPLGRLNVLIGENGCGKTNVLEAICFGGAAVADKLDNEFLTSRGIRYSEPRLMRAGFTKAALVQPIELKVVSTKGSTCHSIINNKNKPYSDWTYEISGAITKIEKSDAEQIRTRPIDLSIKQGLTFEKANKTRTSSFLTDLASFLIFTPDPIALRRLEEEERILPLGIRGEGLFRLLQSFSAEELQQVKEQMKMIEWFDDFQVPEAGFGLPGERSLRIKDQYIADGIEAFDQRSSNEGFLFLLFYVSLLISKHTPPFFAIDNIDNGLNPKLCMRLTSVIASLAAKHDKQVILTTHNPAVLDGLDLKDDEQRLFVVYRNLDGCTRLRRVVPSDLPEGEARVRLSEAFLRGYIGGLPKNF